MELWDLFSHDARRAVIRAHELARMMRSPGISPEHLALAIIDIGEGSGYEMLRGMGVNLEKVSDALRAVAPLGSGDPPEDLPLTSQAERCLQTAHLEWQKRARPSTESTDGAAPQRPRLESIHLLLGLLAPSSRCECRTLISHGVFYGEVCELLRRAQ